MKKGFIFVIAALFVLMAAPGYSATPGTCTSKVVGFQGGTPALQVQFYCVAGDAGAFPATTVRDQRLKGLYIPYVYATVGGTQPQALWDATLKGADAWDYLGGAMTDLAAAFSGPKIPLYTTGVYYQPAVKDTLTLAITGNNVAAAIVTVDVWLWRY